MAPSISPDCCNSIAWRSNSSGEGLVCAERLAARRTPRTRRRYISSVQDTRKWDSRSHPIANCSGSAPLSEEELHHKLHRARTLFNSGFAKVCVCLGDLLCNWVLMELQSQIAAIRERPQRMVQEVVCLYTELKLL